MKTDIDPLLEALRDENPERRQAAAQALFMFGDSRTVGALITALRDPVVGVRFAAALALGNIKDVRVGEALMAASVRAETQTVYDLSPILPMMKSALRVNPNYRVRAYVATVFGQPANDLAIDLLLHALQTDAAPQVRVAALRSLARIGNRQVATAFIEALSDIDAGVRREATEILSDWQIEDAVNAIADLLNDEAVTVRTVAATALGNLNASESLEALQFLAKFDEAPVQIAARDASRKIKAAFY